MQGGYVTLVLAVASSGCGFSPTANAVDAARPIDVAMIDGVDPVTWTVDGTSGKGVPSTMMEWQDLIAARHLDASPPEHLWLAQEAGGVLFDAIGGIVLGSQGPVTYLNHLSGWTRVGVGTITTSANIGFLTTSLGHLDGTSYALLIYVATTPAATTRPLAGIGGNNDHRTVSITPTSTFEADGLGGVTPSMGTAPVGGAVHPILVVIDAPHMTFTVYTDQEVMSPPWVATSGGAGLVSIGSAAFGASASTYLYAALWSGPHAEMTATQVAGLLRGLGWTVTGY